MNIGILLLPLALALGGSFVVAFVFAAFHGQYDDFETPAHRILIDDEAERKR